LREAIDLKNPFGSVWGVVFKLEHADHAGEGSHGSGEWFRVADAGNDHHPLIVRGGREGQGVRRDGGDERGVCLAGRGQDRRDGQRIGIARPGDDHSVGSPQ